MSRSEDTPFTSLLSCGKLDGDALLEALLVLAGGRASPAAREAAGRALLQQMRILAPARAFSTRRATVQGWPTPDAREVLDDCIQHVALVASTGSARFRGTTASEAVAWCSQVLANHIITEVRWRVGQRRRKSAWRDTILWPSGALTGSVQPTQGSGESVAALRQLRRAALAHLQQTRPPRAVQSLYRAVCCYLEHLAGLPLCIQVERWVGAVEPAIPSECRRAQNRLYQYRRRGKQVLNELKGAQALATSRVGIAAATFAQDVRPERERHARLS
jgi:hypothetical protein